MKKLLLVLTLLFGACSWASAQPAVKIRTTPKLPPRDALERMNLTLAWNTRVTVDGNRDGISSIQVLPGKRNQLVVQTYKGMVYLYDADNGDLLWKSMVGVKYWASQPVGFNSQSIFVTRRNMLYVLNRADGIHRVYTYEETSKTYTFGFELAFTPSAAPAADEEFLYMPMSNRVHAIYLPDFDAIDKLKLARKKAKDEKKDPKGVMPDDDIPDGPDSPQPDFYWGYALGDQTIDASPLINGDQLGILTTDGTLAAVSRFERGSRIERELFKTKGQVSAAPAQYRHIAYVGSDDFNLYAVNMKTGELEWRHIGGAPILQAPYVNDDDVFVAPERVGLRRLDRVKGREVWTNRDANRFLAANYRYVYAQDHTGKFFVIDAKRGTTLAKIDFAEWAIPVANEWTDRVYLAANDGQIMCLRNRDLPKALIRKTLDQGPPAKDEKKQPEEKKKDDKEKDKDKDGDKDKEKQTRRQGDGETRTKEMAWHSPSPCLLVGLSPCLSHRTGR